MAILSPSRPRVIPRPSAGVWPGLFDRRRAPIHAGIARALFRTAVRKLPITVSLPDGTRWGSGGPELQIRDDAFFSRLGRDGLIGFGEAYMTGELTTGGWLPGHDLLDVERINAATDELAAALTVMAKRMSILIPQPVQKLRKLWQARPPKDEENTPDGAKENIHRHYDLSNELFELFLDPTMTYSSAWYVPGDDHARDLEKAQLRKIDGVLDLAKVAPGMRILEIGSGWGALAMRAVAERDVHVTTLTLSEEQKALAEQRIAAAGMSDRIEVRLEDYRVHAASRPQAYDAVVSVEMIEAVGEQYWPDYFGAIDRMLTPRGWLGLQAITIDHERLLATRNSYTWVHKYVFPGGILPSLPAIDHVLEQHTDLRMLETRRLGRSYDPTLEQWRHRFNANLPLVRTEGFDETFIRMWNFYLAYSEAGFASGYLDDWQLGIGRG
ncbi:methyltransferase domain-containing protein [Nakamurella sp. YIM 132087]|uniref:Methyltransferase domain-containing protein n=1 Tax=Nakamurella alba TaxID=2665158 RepID=A0A7K1FNC0_9ACTN|nr:cyclopropane-fatty-acyl-phospholipid synthase family protein [Nakamurella alba]MTD15662.1 methyltransferase domain-containing protein [Nakamurella alba]